MVLRRVDISYSRGPIPDHEPTPSRILPVPSPVPSYWLSEPHKYANLRSTPNLPSQCDIAIIGTGMAGVLTAYYILKNGGEEARPKIVLLEARQLCSGATARNGGHAKIKTATLARLDGDDRARNEMQAYVLGVIEELKTVVDAEELAEVCILLLFCRNDFCVFY